MASKRNIFWFYISPYYLKKKILFFKRKEKDKSKERREGGEKEREGKENEDEGRDESWFTALELTSTVTE